MLLKIAFTYTKSIQDAEDIVQDVFLTYLKKEPRFDGGENEKAWLIRVTINRSRDFIKSGWRKNKRELPDNYAAPLNSDIEYESQALLDAVLALKEKYRLPIHFFYYEGYSIEKIAKIIRCKPATVGTRLSRGRQLLKKMLGGIYYEK